MFESGLRSIYSDEIEKERVLFPLDCSRRGFLMIDKLFVNMDFSCEKKSRKGFEVFDKSFDANFSPE